MNRPYTPENGLEAPANSPQKDCAAMHDEHHRLARTLRQSCVDCHDRPERCPLSQRLQSVAFDLKKLPHFLGQMLFYAVSNKRDQRFRIIARDADGQIRIAAFRFDDKNSPQRWELRGASRAVRSLKDFHKLNLKTWTPAKISV